MGDVILLQEVDSSTFSIAALRPYGRGALDWLGRKVQWFVDKGEWVLQQMAWIWKEAELLWEFLWKTVEEGVRNVWRRPVTRVTLCLVIGVVLLYHACYRPTMAKWARVGLLIGGVGMIFFAGVLASQSGLISLPEALLSVT